MMQSILLILLLLKNLEKKKLGYLTKFIWDIKL